MHWPEESCRAIFFQFCFPRGDFLVNSTTNKDVRQEKKFNVRSTIQSQAFLLDILAETRFTKNSRNSIFH